MTDIVLAHRFSAPPGWTSVEYAAERRHHGIVYALAGQMEYRMGDGSRFLLEAGDALYVPKGTIYISSCFGREDFLHMTVNFDIAGDERVFPELRVRRFAVPTRFEQTMASLVRTWTVRHPCYRERCLGLLYELIYLFRREVLSAPPQHMEKLAPARSYLDEHFIEDFPLASLAALCGLSETYFRRLFHTVFHETPAEYRRRLRIARACDLLLSGQFDMERVASLAGYPDPAYFSRMFKKTMGMSPARYRAVQVGRRK